MSLFQEETLRKGPFFYTKFRNPGKKHGNYFSQ